MRCYRQSLFILCLLSLFITAIARADTDIYGYGYTLPPPPPEPSGRIYMGIGANYTANQQADADLAGQVVRKLGVDPVKFFEDIDIVSSRRRLSNEVGFNLFLGYQANPFFGIEGFYDYYGNQNFRFRASSQEILQTSEGVVLANSGTTITEARLRMKYAYMIGLVGTGSIPLASWLNLFAKLGMAYYSPDVDLTMISATVVSPPTTDDDADSTAAATTTTAATTTAATTTSPTTNVTTHLQFRGFALVYGVGLQIFLGPKFSLRMEYDGYATSDNTFVRKIYPNQIALNLVYDLV